MLRWILMSALVLVLSVGSAFAQKVDSRFSKELVSPFQACQSVGLVHNSDYVKYPALVKELARKAAPGKIQALPPTGFTKGRIEVAPQLRPDSTLADRNPITFLRGIGTYVSQYMAGSMARTEKIIGCYAQMPGSAQWKPSLNLDGRADAYQVAIYLAKRNKLPEEGAGGCKEIRANTKKTILAHQSIARVHLALAQMSPSPNNVGIPLNVMPPQSGVGVTGGTAKSREDVAALRDPTITAASIIVPNNDLNQRTLSDVLKAEKLPPLTRAERSKAEAYANEFLKSYNVYLDAYDTYKARGQNYGPLALWSSFFANHRLKYYDQLQQAPVLAYIADTDLSGNDGDEKIFWAALKLWKNAAKAQASVKKALAESVKDLKGGFLNVNNPADRVSDASWDMKNFLVYQQAIENTLKKMPQRCAIASALAYHDTNANLRFMVLSAGAILVASVAVGVIVPPVALSLGGLGTMSFTAAQTAALLMGPPIGLAFTADSYFNYKRAQRAVLNAVVNPVGVANPGRPEPVVAARQALTLAIALEPLDWLGTGVLGRLSFVTAAKVGLRIEGMTAKEMAILITKSESTNPAIANPARKAIKLSMDNYIKGLFGGTTTAADERLAKAMMDAGFMGTVERPTMAHLEEIAAGLKGLKGAERIAVADHAAAIFSRLRPGAQNDLKRAEVVQVVRAAANFGLTDVDQLVRNIDDWTEGLGGLAKVYDDAAKRMDDPAMLENPAFKNGTAEERRSIALEATLDEKLKLNPRYAEMSEADRTATRRQMCLCANMCRR